MVHLGPELRAVGDAQGKGCTRPESGAELERAQVVYGMKKQEPAAMITGLVGPEKKGGWSVQWVAEGARPQPIAAVTLTEAVDAAAAAVAEVYARDDPSAGCGMERAISPW